MRQNRFEFEMIMMVGVLAAALPAFGLSHCAFQRAGDTYTGGCGPLFDQTPAMTLAREAAITTGVWSTDVRPTSAWIGTMTDDGDTDSLELEIDAGGSGVLRTEYGWFAVTQFVASATMSFDLDASQEIQPKTRSMPKSFAGRPRFFLPTTSGTVPTIASVLRPRPPGASIARRKRRPSR